MKHIRTFEEVNHKDIYQNDVKNKIFLIDSSASFVSTLKKMIDNINFYLSDKFIAILCSNQVDEVLNNISLDSLIKRIQQGKISQDGGTIQAGIDYIIKNKLQGDILLFTDGYIEIDVKKLPNDIAILCTEKEPILINNGFRNVLHAKDTYHGISVFMNDLESLDHFYRPRDITPEEYELKKAAQKYNL